MGEGRMTRRIVRPVDVELHMRQMDCEFEIKWNSADEVWEAVMYSHPDGHPRFTLVMAVGFTLERCVTNLRRFLREVSMDESLMMEFDRP